MAAHNGLCLHFQGLRCPLWPLHECREISNGTIPPSIAPCSVSTAGLPSCVCLCDPQKPFISSGRIVIGSWMGMRISFFTTIPHFLLKHPPSGPVVPDMTQVAIFPTASALWLTHLLDGSVTVTPSACLLNHTSRMCPLPLAELGFTFAFMGNDRRGIALLN